jgi:hypothetical protein
LFRVKARALHVKLTRGYSYMATRRQAGLEDERYELPVEIDTDERELEPARVSPIELRPTKAHALPLPNYPVDRRYDTRSRDYDGMIVLPYTDGYLERLERIADAGHYFIELRNGKTILSGGFVHEVKPQLTMAVGQQANATQPTHPQPSPPQSGAHESVLVARELVGLSKDLTPHAQPAPTITLADLERATKEAAREAVEQYKAVQPAPAPAEKPKTATDTVNEIVSIVGAVDKLRGEREPAQGEQKNSGEQFIEQLEMFTTISERLGPKPEGGGGLLDTVASLAEGMGRAAEKIAPHVPKMISAWGAIQQMRAGQQPQANGAQPGQPQQQPDATQPATMLPPAVASTLNLIALDARRDAPVDRAADAIESAAKADPELAEMLEQIKATPSALLVEQVAQLSGHLYLVDLPHVCAWFDSLREELTARAQGESNEDDSGESEAAAVASNNGHGRAATVAQT